MGHLHLHLNRNKRSIALDLKTPEGREACLRAGAATPALQHPPQAMARLGLSYEAVAARNPRIVYLGAWLRRAGTLRRAAAAYDDLIGDGRHRGAVCAASGGAALRP